MAHAHLGEHLEQASGPKQVARFENRRIALERLWREIQTLADHVRLLDTTTRANELGIRGRNQKAQ